MEELEKIKQVDDLLGWGTVSSLLSKAADTAEEMGRDDIVNMLSEALSQMDTIREPSRIFFDAYQFAFRVYFRMKTLAKDMPINRVTQEHRGAEDVYVVTNYDYKMFLWAKSKGYTGTLTNNEFTVSPSSLTPAELRRFEKQAEK